MTTIELNKNNWSGEDTKIKLYADGKSGSIPEYDLKFRVVEKGTYIDEDIDMNVSDYSIEVNDGDNWRETDWKVSTDRTMGKGDWHFATNWDGTISRESTKDVRIAVAQLIFMLY